MLLHRFGAFLALFWALKPETQTGVMGSDAAQGRASAIQLSHGPRGCQGPFSNLSIFPSQSRRWISFFGIFFEQAQAARGRMHTGPRAVVFHTQARSRGAWGWKSAVQGPLVDSSGGPIGSVTQPDIFPLTPPPPPPPENGRSRSLNRGLRVVGSEIGIQKGWAKAEMGLAVMSPPGAWPPA